MQFSLFGVPCVLPGTLLLALPALALGGYSLWEPAVALLLHESGHLLAAKAMGEALCELRLSPLGAALRLSGPPASRSSEAFLAAAGPAASLLFATVTAGLLYFFPTLSFLRGLYRYHLALAAVNLLPALPLDGGRLFRCALGAVFPLRAVEILTLLTGLLAGAALLLCGCVPWPPTSLPPLIFGAFLFSGAIGEWKAQPEGALSRSIRRETAFARRRRLRLQTVALPETTPAAAALRRLDGASLIAVLDSSMRLLGTLAEGDLIDGMMEKGQNVPLSELL